MRRHLQRPLWPVVAWEVSPGRTGPASTTRISKLRKIRETNIPNPVRETPGNRICSSSLLAGINFLALRRLRGYIRLPPVEPSKHNFFSETVPAARNSSSHGPENTAAPLLEPDFQIPLPAGALLGLTFLLSQRVVLSCREREGLNPSCHRSEQPPRQMAFCQEQPGSEKGPSQD